MSSLWLANQLQCVVGNLRNVMVHLEDLSYVTQHTSAGAYRLALSYHL
jgi:transcriptional regulator of heat shock response